VDKKNDPFKRSSNSFFYISSLSKKFANLQAPSPPGGERMGRNKKGEKVIIITFSPRGF
jgi:hypothetical protein